jgi:hypothetical protein
MNEHDLGYFQPLGELPGHEAPAAFSSFTLK